MRDGRKKTSGDIRKDEMRRNNYPGVKEIMEDCTKGRILEEDILRNKGPQELKKRREGSREEGSESVT